MRKARNRGLKLGLLLLAAAFGGCATPGPWHVYLGDAPAPSVVVDVSGETRTDVPSFLEPEDQLTGLAYDPFTDHLFLRLAPGNKIRVVDRPARAIKREFTVEEMSTAGGGDLAVRPRDGHIFFLDPNGAGIAEVTRLGKMVRRFSLSDVTGAAVGVAFDSVANRLFALHADGRTISIHDLDGRRISAINLDRKVGASLAVDGENHELFAPLGDGERSIGVFDFNGRLLRKLPLPGAFVDVGPRSFVRVF